MRNFRCDSCKQVVTDPYHAYEERLEMRRIQGLKRDSVILLRRLCEDCKSVTVETHRPSSLHDQGALL